MDFRFDDEQLALRDTVRAFCTGNDDVTWSALAELGVLALLLPADRGGLGPVEAAIVFEQLGAYLVAGPVLWSTIAAPLVDGVDSGSVRVAGALAGTPLVVEHAPESDVLIVVHDDRVERYDVSAVSGAAVTGEPFDPMTPTVLYGELPAGLVIGAAGEARALRLAGTVLSAAMLVGVAQGALDVASSYALERHQFGVPIGSFQAIKHMLADMYVRTELARSATYAAAAILDDERAGDAAKAASTAKLLAGEAGIANGRSAVQVLGGMGFTWEMPPHYFLKRAWVLEQAFGTGDTHALALGDALVTDGA
jgi:alkylation response protein AidB-like acyl-CoA dehydrogenase